MHCRPGPQELEELRWTRVCTIVILHVFDIHFLILDNCCQLPNKVSLICVLRRETKIHYKSIMVKGSEVAMRYFWNTNLQILQEIKSLKVRIKA